MSKVLEAARAYVAAKKSVIPVSRVDKKPLVESWKPYQERYATDEELVRWFTSGEANVALVTGRISDVMVLDADLDGVQVVKDLGIDSPTKVRTGRGLHLYFRYGMPENFKTRVGVYTHVDTRADGGYVVTVPSTHVTGTPYAWDGPSILEQAPPEFPFHLMTSEKAAKVALKTEAWITEAIASLGSGNRHQVFSRIIGKLNSAGISATDIITLLTPVAQTVGFVTELTTQVNRMTVLYAAEAQPTKLKLRTPADFRPEEMLNRADVVATGYASLDTLIGGLRRGNLTTVGARTTKGKSAFVLNVAVNVARRGQAVVYFTTEMSYREVMERLIKIEPSEEVRNSLKLYICDLPLPKPQHITQALNDVAPSLLIFDHVQRTEGAGLQKRDEVSRLVQLLKFSAVNYNTAVLCASQLSRRAEEPDQRSGVCPRPALYHLKESGTIEEESGVVALLSPQTHVSPDLDLMVLEVAKNRFGRRGTLEFRFRKDVQVFEEVGGGTTVQ